ncbi:MAG: LysM peptidoglycan-binding domain-containing protein [Egibacteraceae bacterium]
MDYEYEPEEEYAPRILWGRIAFFGVAVLLAFVAGYCVKGDGVPESELTQANDQIQALSSENTVLQQRLDAAQSDEGGGGGGGGGGGNADEEPTEGDGQDEVSGEGTSYTVQEGDTLTTIAEKFYGDPTKFDLIVEANNLEDGDGQLTVGQELTIPPEE